MDTLSSDFSQLDSLSSDFSQLDSLSSDFSRLTTSNVFSYMSDLDDALYDIELQIKINDYILNEFIKWVRYCPDHTFPKIKKSWMRTLGSSKRFIYREYDGNTDMIEIKHYHTSQQVFDLLIGKKFLIHISDCNIQLDKRAVLDHNLITNTCDKKRKSTCGEMRINKKYKQR